MNFTVASLAKFFLLFFAAASMATEVWYENQETNAIPFYYIETNKVSYKGNVLDESGNKTPYSLDVGLKVRLHSEIQKDPRFKEISWVGLVYSPEKDQRNNTITSIKLTIGGKAIIIPDRAFEGLSNPKFPGMFKLKIASDGYVVLDFVGSEGEYAYQAAIIFHAWKFEKLQVKDFPNHIEVIK